MLKTRKKSLSTNLVQSLTKAKLSPGKNMPIYANAGIFHASNGQVHVEKRADGTLTSGSQDDGPESVEY